MNAEYTGKKIAELRKVKEFTQKELAEKLHVTDKAVSKWERGVNFPDLGLMEELAKALDSTPSILLGLEDATKEEIVTSFAEISNQQSEEAAKDIQKIGWLNFFVGIFLVIGMHFVNITMVPKGVHHEEQVVQWFIYSLVAVVIIGAVYTLRKYKAIRKFTGVDILLISVVAMDVYAFLVIQLFTGRNPIHVVSAILIGVAVVCLQLVFYRVMTPHWMKLLPLVLMVCWMAWGLYLETTGWNLAVYSLLPAICCFITWFICRRCDKQKESLFSCVKPFAIVFTIALIFLAGIALAGLVGGTKTSSVTIIVEEEIQKPISIYVESMGEEYKLYGNSTIESTEQLLPYNPAKSEGVVWLTIGDEKYEILSYLDYVDSPIVEITGNGTVLEVLVYTTLFHYNKDYSGQSTIINWEE